MNGPHNYPSQLTKQLYSSIYGERNGSKEREEKKTKNHGFKAIEVKQYPTRDLFLTLHPRGKSGQ